MKHNVGSVDETRRNPDGDQGAGTCVPHTQIHSLLRRAFENLQDVVVCLLLLLLLVLALHRRSGILATWPSSRDPPRINCCRRFSSY